MPRKPTSPYGHLVFAKDGSVGRRMFQLSGDKKTQEEQVAQRFLELFGGYVLDEPVTNLRPLPENDHDFAVTVGGANVILQITELVDRMYTFSMTEEEYRAGRWSCVYLVPGEAVPRRLDEGLRDDALAAVIQHKLQKMYAKPEQSMLWLVVFTTAHYSTEFMRGGVLQVSEGLARARRTLNEYPSVPFSEVWFSDLQSRPVKVWPES